MSLMLTLEICDGYTLHRQLNIKPTPHALIMDEEAYSRHIYAKILNRAGYEIHSAANVQKADSLLLRYYFDILFCDIQTNNGRGIDLLRHHAITLGKRGTRIIAVLANNQYRSLCEDMGAHLCLRKPISASSILTLVDYLTTIHSPLHKTH